MISGTLISLRRSNSEAFLCESYRGDSYSSPRAIRSVSYVSMGPVSAALVLYVADRMMSRVLKGQILRKGVPRKVRRLLTMLVQMNVLHEFLFDVIDDIASQYF
jgi:hypothetical protein